MKKAILFIFLVMGIMAQAQITPFIKTGLDLKMLKDGPHDGDDRFADSSLDYEIQAGIESFVFNVPIRISMMYQRHNEINYAKHTIVAVDYILKDFPLKKINCYAGAEVSTIYRWFDTVDYTDPYNYLYRQTTPMRYGLNAEIQYMPFKNIGVSSHINYFQREHDRYSNDPRWEVMFSIVFKLDEIKIDW